MKTMVLWMMMVVIVISGCAERIAINSEKTLTSQECSLAGGRLAAMQNDGTACDNSESDLGKVKDVKCLCQCCVSKR